MSSSEILNGDDSLSSATVELDDTAELKNVKRPDLVEIKDSFDKLEINPILKAIAETNELTVTWQELQPILDTLIKKVFINTSIQDVLLKRNSKVKSWKKKLQMKMLEKMQKIWL